MIPPIDSNLITIRHKLCRTTPFNASQIWQNTRITYLVAELLFVLLLLLLGSCFLLKANYEFVFVRLVFWCRLQSNEKKNTLNNRQLYDWLQMYDYVPDWTIQEWIIKYLRIEWKSIFFLFIFTDFESESKLCKIAKVYIWTWTNSYYYFEKSESVRCRLCAAHSVTFYDCHRVHGSSWVPATDDMSTHLIL